MNTNYSIRIISVKTVPSSTIKKGWKGKGNLQLVTTSAGTFIDSIPNVSWSDVARYEKHGYDWSSLIGVDITVREYRIIKGKGINYNWIKYTL